MSSLEQPADHGSVESRRDPCRPTEFLDYESDAVASFIANATNDAGPSARELAVALYYAIRDGIQYEIYRSEFSRAGLRASEVVARGRGLCIHKSLLYAACARAVGIPSRLVFVDVRNHLASERLKGLMGSDVFCYHCFARVFVEERWIAATPVFNAKLCHLYRLAPLEFDGVSDSVLHPADEAGASTMEVVRHRGEFDDLPYEQIMDGLRSAHPMLFQDPVRLRRGSLVAESSGRGPAR
jgi:transglutaminase-like putative cysteine protease